MRMYKHVVNFCSSRVHEISASIEGISDEATRSALRAVWDAAPVGTVSTTFTVTCIGKDTWKWNITTVTGEEGTEEMSTSGSVIEGTAGRPILLDRMEWYAGLTRNTLPKYEQPTDLIPWLVAMCESGRMFHPYDNPYEVLAAPQCKEPLFTDREAAILVDQTNLMKEQHGYDNIVTAFATFSIGYGKGPQ